MHFYGKNDYYKKRKKLTNVCQHKNMCIPIPNMQSNVCNIRKLSKHFNWFYNTLVKLLPEYSKGYES